MQILAYPSRSPKHWPQQRICEGHPNLDVPGCGALLLVEESDIKQYQIRDAYGEEYGYGQAVGYQCPLCRAWTTVKPL